jgi:hypothetical protein
VGGRKVATTVYLTAEQDSMLKQLQQVTRLPVAELVRRGVDLILDQHREKLVGYPDARARR